MLKVTSRCLMSDLQLAIKSMSTVEWLSVHHNESLTPDMLATLISKTSKLKALLVHSPSFDLQSLALIKPLLSLVRIDIGQSLATPDPLIIALLQNSPQLRILNLRCSQINTLTLHAVATHCAELRELCVSSNSYTDDPHELELNDIAMRKVLITCTHLTTLSASMCTDRGFFFLGLVCASKLVHVTLSGEIMMSMGEDEAITQMAQNCPNIKHLELQEFAYCTDAAMHAISVNLLDLHTFVLDRAAGVTDEGCVTGAKRSPKCG